MLENNTFRTFMLIGTMVVMAIFVSMFLVAPVIPVNQPIKTAYKTVMGVDVGVSTTHPDHLTMYEALLFTIEGKSRGIVRHY